MWQVVRFHGSVPSHPSLSTSSVLPLPLVTPSAFSFCNSLESFIGPLGFLHLRLCSTCHQVTSVSRNLLMGVGVPTWSADP